MITALKNGVTSELAAAPLRVKVKLDRSANIIIVVVGLVDCREIPLPFRSPMALAKGGALWVCAF